jgi:hypothetical protein
VSHLPVMGGVFAVVLWLVLVVASEVLYLMLSGCRWSGNVFGFCSPRKTSSDNIACSTADEIDANRRMLIVACN